MLKRIVALVECVADTVSVAVGVIEMVERDVELLSADLEPVAVESSDAIDEVVTEPVEEADIVDDTVPLEIADKLTVFG